VPPFSWWRNRDVRFKQAPREGYGNVTHNVKLVSLIV
jgi:hypothetical protein